MPQQPVRRAPLKKGRRIPVTVTMDVKTYDALRRIGRGNRSAAIEDLVRAHLAALTGKPEPMATP